MSINLRYASMSDADFLLRVKNDRDVRRWSIVTHKKILRKNHLKWLKKTLNNVNRQLWVVYYEGKPVGDMRIDWYHNGGEISIRLLPKYRSQGIATWLLRNQPHSDLYCKIVEGNFRSMNLFTKCGYTFSSHRKGYYILKRTRLKI